MPDSDDTSLPSDIDTRAEARSFTSARQHVGAAGFAQSNVLEQIISAGREQIEVTRSLRQVITATQTQLRALRPSEAADATQPQVVALQHIVREGQAQIEAANELRQAIQRTLADVRGTPVEEVSANVLHTLGEIVRQQAAALEDLISAAITEASTSDQVAKLERVSEETQTRLENAEHQQVERELVQLDLLGQQALERIRSLEASGQTHAAQKGQLEQEAEVAQRSITALEGAETQNVEDLARLQQQAVASEKRITALEGTVEKSRIQIVEANREMNTEKQRDN